MDDSAKRDDSAKWDAGAKRGDGAKRDRKKVGLLAWRGMLSDTTPVFRAIIALVLGMLSVLLTFTQMGFMGIPLSQGNMVYIVSLLVQVALGSLLLGTGLGTFLGAVSGAVLLLHAQFIPLDYYELLFIRLFSSVILLALAGFFSGIFFAKALRRDPPKVRRVVYIVIVCFIVSILFSIAFATHAIWTFAVRVATNTSLELSNERIQALLVSTVVSLGDVGLQMLFDALIMAVFCSLADHLARLATGHQETMGIRTIFGSWLSVVGVLLLMGVAAVSLAVITEGERKEAEADFKDEASYLCKQISKSALYGEKFSRVIEESDIEAEATETAPYYDLVGYFANDLLLSGYTLTGDGTVVVLANGAVCASDDSRFPYFAVFEEDACADMVDAVKRSLKSDALERFVYDETEQEALLVDNDESYDSIGTNPPYIAYLYAQNVTVANSYHDKVTYTVIIMQPSEMVFSRTAPTMISITLAEVIMMLGAFGIVFLLLNRVVADGIDEENKALALICEGELETRATASGTIEFESLSEGINTTVDALKGWIVEAETRMDTELNTAKAIQESAMPGIFPPYPGIPRFDIYAMMHAARHVGGDFYDFFLVGDDCDAEGGKLAFVVADVSGKGIPGALLMMKAKAQIRNYVGSGMELGEAMEEVNRQLLDGNDEGMFVTAWVGLLDYGTGHVEYVNAGHNPPLLWQREGGWRWIRQRSGPMLGVFDIPYRAHSIDCRAGDTFLLYTDGVTEAFDADERLYGEDRLLEVAEKGYKLHPRELLESVRDDVARHAHGAEQSDDITILTLEVGVPPETTAALVVDAEIDELSRVNDFLHSELDRRLCPTRVQNQLDIAVEELFVNVCNYAYEGSDESGTVRVQRTYCSDPPSITVDFIDSGVAFDPLAKPDAVTPGRIEDVPIGGLGILMVKKCVDEFTYERTDGFNVVTIVKRW